MFKKIVLILIVVFIAIQFVQIDKHNPSYNPQEDYINIHNPPEDVKGILKASCYDCHSYETKYPWYSYIQPVGWFLKDHIDEGREHLNFSIWRSYDREKQLHKLEECYEEVEKKKMPLESYVYGHAEANLTDQQRATLVEYFKNSTNI